MKADPKIVDLMERSAVALRTIFGPVDFTLVVYPPNDTPRFISTIARHQALESLETLRNNPDTGRHQRIEFASGYFWEFGQLFDRCGGIVQKMSQEDAQILAASQTEI